MEYFYKCDKCQKEYTEVREAGQPQWFTICDVCGGNFVETEGLTNV